MSLTVELVVLTVAVIVHVPKLVIGEDGSGAGSRNCVLAMPLWFVVP